MTTLIATSVVRGSKQGESHGGIFLIDLDRQQVAQPIDWNTTNIDWQGRGWDRGLRGIEFDGDKVYIAASNELFVYNRDFEQVASYRSPYLKHCHEISRYQRRLYLTSTGYDSIIGFDLDKLQFSWGLHIAKTPNGFAAALFTRVATRGRPQEMNSISTMYIAWKEGCTSAGSLPDTCSSTTGKQNQGDRYTAPGGPQCQAICRWRVVQ